ncbi:solute carrier family 12 member 2-like [Uloborus diversus]|uniref:solute carrier family 12 member 2-like n=1 Tax=Uloborus diversus TaxID=327109 RepID=UPI0024094A47|nr:solute carrier family 12 member 2-like [Uloborus diversus]
MNEELTTSRFQVEPVENATQDGLLRTEDLHVCANDHSINSNVYDSKNIRSLCYYTQEALPRLDHYRNVHSLHAHCPRPTLEELHNGDIETVVEQYFDRKSSKVSTEKQAAVKFGWIQGVLVRCLLNIWGVMLFLRLSWVTGQAGIGLACVIVSLATVVTVLTTLSMSAICTNGEVKGGGTYYMISRSLGPEFGGSIGFIFAVANAVAVAMYVVGFAETFRVLLIEYEVVLFERAIDDIRVISCITVVVLLGIAIIGTEWETKAQIVLLLILLAAMADFLVGACFKPTEEQISKGFMGFNATLALENLGPHFTEEEGFFTVFSVFFPAATGITAGANISGDLRDPQKAIPKGTLWAIFITTISYLLFIVVCGSAVLLEANGEMEFVINGTLDLLRNCTIGNKTECEYGLIRDYQVMEMVSAFSPIIYGGIFAATLSSALASLVSAPKIFQALCKDKLFPGIHLFAKGYGKNNEPRRGYLLAFFVALGCCAIGDLNLIAPLISNFFLAAYCLINLSCFHATFVKAPGFRPAFRYYSMWLGLLGAFLCLLVMFIINWVASLVTFAVVSILYVCIYQRKPDVNWGSSTQAQTYSLALNAVMKLNDVADHVKNYRPQLLVLSGHPSHRPPLIDFSYTITKKLSLLICGNVITKEHLSHKVRSGMLEMGHKYLRHRSIKAFYSAVEDQSFSKGVSSLIQVAGMGKLKPNMILMGYKNDWESCAYEEIQEYFNVIHDALDMHMAIGILRHPSGLDYSKYATQLEKLAVLTKKERKKRMSMVAESKKDRDGMYRNKSCSELSEVSVVSCNMDSSRESSPPSSPTTTVRSLDNGHISRNPQVNLGFVESQDSLNMEIIGKDLPPPIPDEVKLSANQFQRRQKKGYIDVWWLYDDGGLTMLIPHILSTRSQWSGCKLRIFALANKKDELDREQRNMAALLNKFRIDYSDVTVIPDIVKPPEEASKKEFEALITKWQTESTEEPYITESELYALKDKTNRHIRLSELLRQHSKNSVLIVMTLPMPRKSTCSAALYMAWLETLTKDMPTFLLIRGNQTSVLTFYS